MQRTDNEINRMIAQLKKERESIRHYSAFGDDNWAAIDAQLDVLECNISEESEIYDKQDNEDWDEYTVNAALDAFRWMDGEDSMELEDTPVLPTFNLTAEVVGKQIGIRHTEWTGRCYEIAAACLNANVIKGKLCYGHWTGPIDKESHFKDRRNIGFTHHGWVELEGGFIFDPTRFAFESKEPYIYVGINDHYDVGGNRLIQSNRTPAPAYDAKNSILVQFEQNTSYYVNLLLDEPVKRKWKTYGKTQIHWLANLPLNELGIHAKNIYTAIREAGMAGSIPIDNWNYVK